MILYIDTTQKEKLEVRIYDSRREQSDMISVPFFRNESELLLKIIDDILKKNTLQKPQGIIVVKGATGRFSRIRLGVTIANALGFAWDVPVFGILQNEGIESVVHTISESAGFEAPVIPVYGKEPNVI